MQTTVPVTPGINLTRHLDGKRPTKKWVREAMREHPEWDWREYGTSRYVNGGGAIQYDLTLDVKRVTDGFVEHVAFVDFQADDTSVWGYQAVVR